jgi:hypothetical protein
VTYAVRDAKKFEVARTIGADLVQRISHGSTLAQAASALHLPHQEFPPFTRTNPPLTNPKLVGTAFGLAVSQTSGLIDTNEGLYLIQVVKREPADSAEFVKKIDELRPRQINLARQDRVRNYLAALRTTAEVVDRRAQVFRTDAQSQQQQARQRS